MAVLIPEGKANFRKRVIRPVRVKALAGRVRVCDLWFVQHDKGKLSRFRQHVKKKIKEFHPARVSPFEFFHGVLQNTTHIFEDFS